MNLASLMKKPPASAAPTAAPVLSAPVLSAPVLSAPVLSGIDAHAASVPMNGGDTASHAAAPSAKALGLLGHWASRTGMLKRILHSAKAEISHASRDMEAETGAVVVSFQDVAGKARSQSERISDLASLANRVSVEGQEVELGTMASLFDSTLDGILAKIETLSRQAVSMVGVLDGMSKSLDQVEQCIGKVEIINRQANMLAVNARIEAARAGSAGQAFGVVANEIGQLSQSTKSLSETMRLHMGEVVGAIRSSHDALQQVATLDMSENVEMKQKLDRMVSAMVDRNAGLGRIVTEAAADQVQISRQIGHIITGMQFQDRVTQRLEQVLDTLTVLGDAVGELHEESRTAAPEGGSDKSSHDVAWLKGLSSRYKLSEMRARFVARVIDGEEASDAVIPATSIKPVEAGSIELF